MSSLSLMYVYSLQWFSTLYLYRSQFELKDSSVLANITFNPIFKLFLQSKFSHSGLSSTFSKRWCLMHLLSRVIFYLNIMSCVLTALRTRTSRRCWVSGFAISATISPLTASLRSNPFSSIINWHFHCFSSGESVAVPEGQEDLHLHPLPRHDDLQAAARDQGRWYLDGRGAFTADC